MPEKVKEDGRALDSQIENSIATNRQKILFIVPSLSRGGAETQLIGLINGLDPSKSPARNLRSSISGPLNSAGDLTGGCRLRPPGEGRMMVLSSSPNSEKGSDGLMLNYPSLMAQYSNSSPGKLASI